MHIVCDLAVFAAHDTSDADFFFRVADHQNLIVQLADLTIQRLELISVLCTADDDLMSCDRVQIICMHRLSVLCHNVVRDVYQVIDWPDTCCSQTSLHPLRARSDFDIFADPCAVTGAQIGILYFYVHIIVYIFAVFVYFHNRGNERLSEGCSRLSCDA